MSDTDPMKTPIQGFETATKSMQAFASEMQTMSQETLDRAADVMTKMRGAKTMEEVVSLQTNFMQQSFTSYTDYTRKLGDLMMALPMELAKQSQAAFQKGTEQIRKASE